MQSIRSAATCRWAQPEAFVPLPGWVAVWQSPWRCVDDQLASAPLDRRPDCATCARWRDRGAEEIGWLMTQVAI